MHTRQLESDTHLTSKQYYDIADLIYETDSYIYPALFDDAGEKENAIFFLSRIIENGGDRIFNLNNIFACFDNNIITGIILWVKTPVRWDENIFTQIAEEEGIILNVANVQAVKNEYFNEDYGSDNKSRNDIVIENVCVKKENRGKGCGSYMLESFISEHRDAVMKLNVLCNNNRAIQLYTDKGFEIKRKQIGFSIGEDKPTSYEMIRQINLRNKE